MSASIIPTAIPTGGAISLAISGAVSGVFSLSRAVSGQSFSVISSGTTLTPLQLWIDAGDGLPEPLEPNLLYNYQYTDGAGTVTTGFVQPSASLQITPDPISQLLIRLLQGAINSLPFPTGIQPAQVTQAMPVGGDLKLPLVVVNLDLFQQDAVPIGQPFGETNPTTGATTITGFCKRIYQISALATDVITRNFYRDNLAGIFEALLGPVLIPLGLDATHRWQGSSYQVASDRLSKAPGFFGVDFMLEFTGTFNVAINTAYGLIESFNVTIVETSQGGGTSVTDTVLVPP